MPMEVKNELGLVMLRIASIHKAAGRTIREDARTPIKTVHYTEPPSFNAAGTAIAIPDEQGPDDDIRPVEHNEAA
jgi:hypothetical protein